MTKLQILNLQYSEHILLPYSGMNINHIYSDAYHYDVFALQDFVNNFSDEYIIHDPVTATSAPLITIFGGLTL